MESLKIVITLMVIATAFLVGGSVALAQSGANAPATANLTLRDGVNPGEVVVSWDAVPEATYYRIGYVNMVTDYPLAKASRTGNWLEAFVYVDVEAQNFTVANGRVQYTVRRLEQDARHAFTVLTSNSFSNTTETVVSTFSWPSNPRWRFLTVADRGGAPAPASPTVDYVSMYPNCDAVRAHYPGGVRQGSPIYRSALDPDGDGLACEPVGTPSGTPSKPTEARIDVSSTSASATVEMKLTVDNFPMNAVEGGSIELYLEDDFQVPNTFSASSVYFVATNPSTAATSNGGRIYATAGNVYDGDHFGGRDDWAIRIFIPDMRPGGGYDGPEASQTLSMIITQSAGIKNPSEEGTHSVGYSILGPNDKPNEGPTGQLGATVTYAKISLSDEDNTRGYRLTVTGSGFNNGATAAVYVLSRVPAKGRECEDIIANGTRVGSATVGSDDRVSVTFAVTVPPFVPGDQNYICMADSEGRMSKTDVEQFTLETGGDGTRRTSPIPYGQRFQAGVFDIQIASVDTDYWPELQQANRSANPPPSGKRYVMWTLQVWNDHGSHDESEAIHVYYFKLTGNRATTYEASVSGVSCGGSKVPNRLNAELYRTGTATGAVCFAVPIDEIGTGLTLRYNRAQSTDNTTGRVSVWFDALPE